MFVAYLLTERSSTTLLFFYFYVQINDRVDDGRSAEERERMNRFNVPLSAFRIASALAATLILSCAVATRPQAAEARRAKPASEAAPAPPPVLPDPPLPVRDATQAGIGQCAPILDLMSKQSLTQAYDVQSGWSRADPAHHIFQSVAASTTPGNVPPDGVTALVAAPVTGGGCDGVSLQVFPLAGDCPSAMKTMLKDGKLLAPLMNTRIMVDGRGNRVFLLPAYRDTCIAVSVDTRFGTP